MIGGLMGLNEWGTITDCYATGSVLQTGDFGIVGGLIGYNATGTITGSYATGSVSGYLYVGGITGANGGTMSNCYAEGGSASGEQYVGGLVGYNMDIISNSYSNYSVSGTTYVGGVAGWNVYGTITNSYANGSASGYQYVGGLVGQNGYSEGGNNMLGMISKCYSTGSVGGTGLTVGGLVGDLVSGAVSASFWDVQTSGASSSDAGTGLPTAEMQMMSTFTNAAWDFTTPVWTIEEGNDYPRFWWEIVPVLHAEPEISLGTNNTISWDPIPGVVEYYAECAED
ncbi:MAG: GLUG motif-containing protein, partial [Planctomycetota bacterium]